MKKLVLRVLSSLLLILIPFSNSMASVINFESATLTRTIRGTNSMDWSSGDRILINATLNAADFNGGGGESETSMSGGAPTGNNYDLDYHDFFGTPMYSRTVSYSPTLLEPWELFVTNQGDTVSQTTNSLSGVEAVPFVRNVKLQGAGLTPTVTWTIDDSWVSTDVAGKRVQVFLHDADGNRIWHSGNSASAANTSIAIPDGVLEEGKKYTARVKVFERDSVTYQPLSQTETFIDFTPLKEGSPDHVFMPVVSPDTNPDDDLGASAYFNVDVLADTPIFIDPLIAVGYDYRIGDPSDPLFSSVVLPFLGDDEYKLWLENETGLYLAATLYAGQEYTFGDLGVGFFRILGIEENLGLDPEDVTAFITELKFNSTGIFRGAMTPITKWVDPVPEPSSMLLFGFGLLGLAGAGRKKILS